MENSSKIFMPFEAANLMSSIGSLSDIVKDKKDAEKKEAEE